MVKQIKIVKIVSLANKNNFYQFIYIYFIFLRPNTLIKYRFTDNFKALLTNFFSFL